MSDTKDVDKNHTLGTKPPFFVEFKENKSPFVVFTQCGFMNRGSDSLKNYKTMTSPLGGL